MDILGSMFQIAQADIVVLYAPKVPAAWLVKNRFGPGSQAPDAECTNLDGAIFLLLDLDDGTVDVRPALDVGR